VGLIDTVEFGKVLAKEITTADFFLYLQSFLEVTPI
jgi:hypothetical protein